MKPTDQPNRGYIEGYQARARRRRELEEEAARRALTVLPELARRLRRDLGVRRVGYFGSLTTGRLAPDSDIDLYVDRVRRGGYFRALDLLCSALERPVDLVEVESAPDSLRACIESQGVEIDE